MRIKERIVLFPTDESVVKNEMLSGLCQQNKPRILTKVSEKTDVNKWIKKERMKSDDLTSIKINSTIYIIFNYSIELQKNGGYIDGKYTKSFSSNYFRC